MFMGSGPGSPEAQAVAAMLQGMDAESAVAAISQVLTAKPELAPAIVGFAVPDLTYAPSRAFTERRAKGVVKQYNEVSGFGFIECPELHAVFGKDVFVHARQLSCFEIGTEVTFAVVLNKDNKPQAVDLLNMHGKGGDGKTHGKGVSAGGKGKFDGFSKGVGGGGSFGKGGKLSTAKPDEQATLGQFTGFIKSFNNKNGYGFGFIQSEEMKAQGYATDVYVHHLQLNGCEVMQEISFVAYLNSKMQPQARDVVPLGPPPSLQGAGAPMASLHDQGFGVLPFDQQGWSAEPPTGSAPMQAPFPGEAVPVVPHVPVRAEFIYPLSQHGEQQQHQFAAVEGYGTEGGPAYEEALYNQQNGLSGVAESHGTQAQPSDATPSVASLIQQMDQAQWSAQQTPFALGHPFAEEDPEAKRQRLAQQGW